MHSKATSLLLLAAIALLAPVRSAPTHLQERQYDDSASGMSSASSVSSTAAPAATSSATGSTDIIKQNGLDAQALNLQFASINVTDSCDGMFFNLFSE